VNEPGGHEFVPLMVQQNTDQPSAQVLPSPQTTS